MVSYIMFHLGLCERSHVCVRSKNLYDFARSASCNHRNPSILLFTESSQEKGTFWKENTATSLQPLPVIAPQAKRGIDWQGFQFQTPQSCQHRTSTASCLPHAPIISVATFLFLTTNITFVFWPPFVAQTTAHMGLKGLIPECFKSDTGAVVSEDPFSAIKKKKPLPPPHKKWQT